MTKILILKIYLEDDNKSKYITADNMDSLIEYIKKLPNTKIQRFDYDEQ